jgi:hypothetical protein
MLFARYAGLRALVGTARSIGCEMLAGGRVVAPLREENELLAEIGRDASEVEIAPSPMPGVCGVDAPCGVDASCRCDIVARLSRGHSGGGGRRSERTNDAVYDNRILANREEEYDWRSVPEYRWSAAR